MVAGSLTKTQKMETILLANKINETRQHDNVSIVKGTQTQQLQHQWQKKFQTNPNTTT
jgi:hypothetical protein